VYRLFVSPTIGGHGNSLLGDRLFGVGLGSHFRDAFGGSSVLLGHVAVFVVLIAALAAVATWSSLRMRRAATVEAPAGGGMARLMALMPYFTVLGAVVLPLASSLYVATTTLWTLVERRRMLQPAPVQS
jgi:YidC/Oxa1 family membrane protein insertase